jgi:hypothetical protein
MLVAICACTDKSEEARTTKKETVNGLHKVVVVDIAIPEWQSKLKDGVQIDTLVFTSNHADVWDTIDVASLNAVRVKALVIDGNLVVESLSSLGENLLSLTYRNSEVVVLDSAMRDLHVLENLRLIDVGTLVVTKKWQVSNTVKRIWLETRGTDDVNKIIKCISDSRLNLEWLIISVDCSTDFTSLQAIKADSLGFVALDTMKCLPPVGNRRSKHVVLSNTRLISNRTYDRLTTYGHDYSWRY